MRENVSIAYRGARYELGRGEPRYYGIWTAGSEDPRPLEWWPETADGWVAAWARFSHLEQAGPITQLVLSRDGGDAGTATGPAQTATYSSPANSPENQTAAPYGQPTVPYGQPAVPYGQPTGGSAGHRDLLAVAVIGIGVVLGVAGLFGAYLGGTSLASQAYNLVPHLIYLSAWAASAVLVLRGGRGQRIGAFLGLGTSAVTFGLFLADAGYAISAGNGLASAGLVLSLAGWLACTAGAVLALAPFHGAQTGPAGLRLRGHQIAPLITMILAALGAAIAFAPSWDSYTLRTLTGVSQTITAGNAFANPGLVIAGDVAVMIAVVLTAAFAGFWRPARQGAALLAGAAVPLIAQAVSAIIQIRQAPSPAAFGFSPAQATQAGLTISTGLTLAFWVYGAFVVALSLSVAWLASAPDPGGAGYRSLPEAVSAGFPVSPSGFQPGAASFPGPARTADAFGADAPGADAPGRGGSGDETAPVADREESAGPGIVPGRDQATADG